MISKQLRSKRLFMKSVFTTFYICSALIAQAQVRMPVETSDNQYKAIEFQNARRESSHKSNSSIKERLIAYSLFNDTEVWDSANYVYSHGRGSHVGNDLAWLYDGFSPAWWLERYNAEPVLIAYDSAHRYIRWNSPNAAYLKKETSYRKYDLANRLIRDSLNSPVFWNLYTDITYDINKNPVHYQYNFLPDSAGNMTLINPTVIRIISYNGNGGRRDKDSVYDANYPLRFTESLYDTLGRLQQLTITDGSYHPAAGLQPLKRESYTYDLRGRLSTIHVEWGKSQFNNTNIWADQELDTFGYQGNNTWNNYFAVRTGDSIKQYTSYLLDTQGRWDTAIVYWLDTDNQWIPYPERRAYDYTPYGNLKAVTHIGGGTAEAEKYWRMYYEEYMDIPNYVPAQPIKLSVYPNPVSDYLHIPLGNVQSVSVALRIIDAVGRESKRHQIAPTNEAVISVSNLSDGYYIIQLLAGDVVVQTASFIKRQ